MEGMREPSPEKRQIPESIASAAIKFNGELYTDRNHFLAIQKLESVHPDWKNASEQPEKGFLTTTGRFVDRAEAGEIADRASQLNHLEGEEHDEAASNLNSYNLRH